ncbi:MAG: ATP-binding protein, partial [Bradymonadia bacterium]
HPRDEWFTQASKAKGVGLLTMAQPPLVGRIPERDLIWSALLTAIQEGLRVVLIDGPSGIGKTALMNWLGVRVSTFGVALPLNVSHTNLIDDQSGLSGLLRREMRLLGLVGEDLQSRVENVCELLDLKDDIQSLLTILSPHLVGTSDMLHQNARYEVLARFLERLCEFRPRVLMIDDYQWQDEVSGFLKHLATTRKQLKMLVLVSNRVNQEAASTASEWDFLGLPIDAVASHIVLKAFEREEFETFVNAHIMVTDETLDRLFEISRGHPLSLKLALQEFAVNGQLSASSLGYHLDKMSPLESTDGVRKRWLGPLLIRNQQFPDLVLSLEVAAVLGVEMNLVEWLEVCETLGVSLPFGSIDVLVDEGFLAFDEFEHGRFVHRQCHEMLTSQLGGSQKVSIHAAIARVLAKDSGGCPWRLAQHWFGAQEYQAVLDLLPLAWKVAIRQDRFSMAKDVLRHWFTCLRRLGVGMRSREWLSVKLKWSEWLHLTGRGGNAIRHAKVVAGSVSSQDERALHVEALLLWTLAAKWQIGAAQDNLSRIERAKRLAQVSGQPALVLKCVERNAVYLHTYGDLERSRDEFSLALRLLEGETDAPSSALVHRGISRLFVDLGDMDAAKAYGEAALNLTEQLPNKSLEASIRLTLGDIARRTSDFEGAARHYTKAASIFQHLGAPDLWAAWANSGLLAQDEGEWSDGAMWFGKALALVKPTGNDAWILMLKSCLLRALAHLDKWTEFDAVLADLLSKSEHDYAQKDSCDQLSSLHAELLNARAFERALSVRELCQLQREACGL